MNCGWLVVILIAPTTGGAQPTYETEALAREAVALGGQRPAEAGAILQNRLREEYGFDVSCETSFFGGDGERIRCFASTRRLARILYRRILPGLDLLEREVLRVRFGRSAGLSETSEQARVTAGIPFSAGEAEILHAIQAALVSSEFRKNLAVLRAFQSFYSHVQEGSQVPLVFDERIPISRRWTFLHNLMAIAQDDPRSLNRVAEKIYVTSGFMQPHEEGMQLVEYWSAYASAPQLRNYLRAGFDPFEIEREVIILRDMRARLNEAQTELRRRTNAKVDCSSSGGLRVRECLVGVRRLTAALAARPDTELAVKNVFFVAGDEMSEFSTTFNVPSTGETVLAMRPNFRPQDFSRFLLKKGWSPP